MRIAYLSQHRADLRVTVKELSSKMCAPRRDHMKRQFSEQDKIWRRYLYGFSVQQRVSAPLYCSIDVLCGAKDFDIPLNLKRVVRKIEVVADSKYQTTLRAGEGKQRVGIHRTHEHVADVLIRPLGRDCLRARMRSMPLGFEYRDDWSSSHRAVSCVEALRTHPSEEEC
eukprot:3768890-Amphidinium_carterae.2